MGPIKGQGSGLAQNILESVEGQGIGGCKFWLELYLYQKSTPFWTLPNKVVRHTTRETKSQIFAVVKNSLLQLWRIRH